MVNKSRVSEWEKKELALQAAKELEQIFDAVPDLIAVIDNECRIVRANKAMARKLGITQEECIGLVCYRVVHGVDNPPSFCPHQQLLKDGFEHAIEIQEDKLGGNFVLSVTPLFNPEGKLIGSVHVARDITERKRSEKLLQESEARYRSLYENSLDGILLTKPDGTILSANPKACSLYGMTENEILQAGRERLVVNDEKLEAALKERELTGQMKAELTCIRKDGSTFLCEVASNLFEDANGDIKSSMIVRDITRRKQIEKELQESEEKYRNIVETASEGIWIGNSEARTTYINKRMAEMAGYTQDEMIGKHGWDFTDEEGKPIIKKNIEKRRQGVDESYEFKFLRKDGSPLWTIVSSKSFFDDDGKFTGSMSMLTDITKRKEIEAKLKETLDNLEQLVEQRTSQLEEAYKSLKESERSLAEAQKMAHLGNWERSLVNGKLHWSDELYRIFGLKPQEFEMTYDIFLSFVHPDDRDYVDSSVKKTFSGKPFDINYRIITLSGEERIVYAQGETVFKEKNNPARIRGIVQDITKYVQEESRIYRYNHILEGINRIFSHVVQAKTEEELGSECLFVALEVTNSQIGFVGEIGADGLLHDIAISDMGWEQCAMYDKTGHQRPPGDFVLHGLYGCVIDTGKSFFINNPRSHPNSIGLPQGHPALTSFLGVPLVQNGKAVGILAVANREGGYSCEQQEDLEAIAPAVTQALQRKKAEEALAEIEEARIKEIHHRIKNNLQVISSLLSLQAEKFTDPKILDAFKDSQNRIVSMALIHEELYQGNETDNLDFAAYIQKLIRELFSSYNLRNEDISLKMNLEETYLGMDTAIPLGIIVNELVSNSLKHAFSDRKQGEINISLKKTEDPNISKKGSEANSECKQEKDFHYTLTVSDNGQGIPEEIYLQDVDSLGLQLVNILVEQIDGCIELRRDHGTEFTIWFSSIEK